jgi:hypothetical protein
MLPVHFDLFLYVMKEKDNRLFLREYQIRLGYFFLSNGNEGGRVFFPGFRIFKEQNLNPLHRRLCPARAKRLEERADRIRTTLCREIWLYSFFCENVHIIKGFP